MAIDDDLNQLAFERADGSEVTLKTSEELGVFCDIIGR
jgi:hypothetical protein